MSRNPVTIGVLAALGAYGIWGFIPAYFKLLQHVPPAPIIAHRILWTLLLILLWQALRHRGRLIRALRVPRQTLWLLALSAVLISINWLAFVWAVANDQVLATSLGYFINPLVNIFLGMAFLRERLDRFGWIALALAATGTLYLGIRIGEPPWVALLLAFSFGGYGLVRKIATEAGPLTGLWWETLWLAVPAWLYLRFVDGIGLNPMAPYDATTAWLLIGAAVGTLIPLALFARAARSLTLSTLGFFQYLAPSISFLLAVFVYDEPFSTAHGVAFGLIWTGLLVLTFGPRLTNQRSSQAQTD